MEVKPMNFDELMAANPAAKIEYDNKIIAAKEAGKKEIDIFNLTCSGIVIVFLPLAFYNLYLYLQFYNIQ